MVFWSFGDGILIRSMLQVSTLCWLLDERFVLQMADMAVKMFAEEQDLSRLPSNSKSYLRSDFGCGPFTFLNVSIKKNFYIFISILDRCGCNILPVDCITQRKVSSYSLYHTE